MRKLRNIAKDWFGRLEDHEIDEGRMLVDYESSAPDNPHWELLVWRLPARQLTLTAGFDWNRGYDNDYSAELSTDWNMFYVTILFVTISLRHYPFGYGKNRESTQLRLVS